MLGGEGEGSVPVYVQALLEQTAENMENLQRILARGEDGRRRGQPGGARPDRADRHAVGHHARQPAADAAHRRDPAGARRRRCTASASAAAADGQGDEIARAHLRNIELYLQRLLTETEQGRAQTTAELRNDIRVLTRTIAALAEEQPR